jgi:hypothetical protein
MESKLEQRRSANRVTAATLRPLTGIQGRAQTPNEGLRESR